MSERPSFPEVGLPAEHRVVRLGYHESARTVVAQLRPAATAAPTERLFFRRDTDTRYQPIEPLTQGASVTSYVLDPRRPVLYFLAYVYRPHTDGGWSGDWDALYSFDLGQHRCERLIGSDDLPAPSECSRAWLCDFLSVGADGRSMFCTAGVERPSTIALKTGPVNGSRADYWVARLDLETRELTAVSELAAFWA